MRMGTYYRAALIKSLGLDRCQGRVLDVGGFDGFFLSKIDALQKVSVDIETIPLYGGVDYCLSDGLRLPFKENSFDAIYALDVLEHVEDEGPFVQELMRVLKSGGCLFLSTPQHDIRIFPGALQSWVNRRWQHHRTPGYTQSAIEDLFEPLAASRVCISKLSAWWFLKLYIPLSLIWRIAPRFRKSVLGQVARLDSSRRGIHGYLLAEVTK